MNNISKKFNISKSAIDNMYRVYEWMTLSDITNEKERDNYKKWICIGISKDEKGCKIIIEKKEKTKSE